MRPYRIGQHAQDLVQRRHGRLELGEFPPVKTGDAVGDRADELRLVDLAQAVRRALQPLFDTFEGIREIGDRPGIHSPVNDLQIAEFHCRRRLDDVLRKAIRHLGELAHGDEIGPDVRELLP